MTEVSYEVREVKRETRFGMFSSSGNVEGWSAQVTVNGETWFASKLDGEDRWTVDARFGANGYPFWSNGFGARYLRTHSIDHDGLVSALDAAAAAQVSA